MNPRQRNLNLAIGASLALHAVVLSIHFKLPDAISKATQRSLDVILVNSKSATRPTDAQAKAQTDLDGGGNTPEDRRATTPLPPDRRIKEGDDLINAQRRVAQLEAERQQAMTQLRSQKSIAAVQQRNEPAPPAPPSQLSGLDLANRAMAITRLEGEIATRTDPANKYPLRKILGSRTIAVPDAMYVNSVIEKIERIGTLNFPPEARGKLSGKMMVTLVIKPDGSLHSFELNNPSEHKILNAAAERIARMGSPYPRVPAEVLGGQEVVAITRHWTFSHEDLRTASTR